MNNPLIDIFFIPITCLLDIVLILWEEILFWSLMRGKGLNYTQHICDNHRAWQIKLFFE